MRTLYGANLTALADYLAGQLQRDAVEPLHRQLYRYLRHAVLDGRLASGIALPASRNLAVELGLGRNTVLHAYEQLCAEGYCQSRRGAGIFVSASSPDWGPSQIAPGQTTASVQGLSQRASNLLADTQARVEYDETPAFTPGRPDLSLFPWRVWWRLLQARQRDASPDEMGYRYEGGHRALREALVGYLRLSRGVNCTAEQILITGGMQQSLDLIARSMADVGDIAWIEEPGYNCAATAFEMAGLQVEPIPQDEAGIDWTQRKHPAARLIYVTPSHQYPLGSVMSLVRRQALLAEAKRQGAWIIEDDYDSEFRHTGQPLAALQGLDSQGRVLYLGTFSKVLFPALRLGYLVAPVAVVKSLCQLQARLYRESDYTVQAALADFITEGHFGSHLRRMRGVYARRQAKLRDTLAAELGDTLPLLGGEAGMHVVARLPDGCDDRAISAALARAGMMVPALSAYCRAAPPFPGLVLGYGGIDDAVLRLAVVQLATQLRRLQYDAHQGQ
ncbi:MocR-like pyridoxine biosynthesis transcription factor PdxR [Chitinimonas sp. PSY-7]|uniref:MocR-like pyridoxine biosynthesis transcription factor PdxR n=1 Tax=Chitinimonas sp. PSY-7 TaxID=3459088 RepID=UPI0040402748